jgi:hypothetical protein
LEFRDLTRKLEEFKIYYNNSRVHQSLAARHRLNILANVVARVRRSILSVGKITAGVYIRLLQRSELSVRHAQDLMKICPTQRILDQLGGPAVLIGND